MEEVAIFGAASESFTRCENDYLGFFIVLFHKISITIKETPLVLTPHPLSQSGMQFLFSINLKLLFKDFGLCLLLSKIFSL